MSQSLNAVKGSLQGKTLDGEILCALDPSYDTKLPTEYVHWAPTDYSRIFRAYSAACLILNESPAARLIDSPVEIPNQTSWLGQELLKLLNGTVEGGSEAPYQFDATAYSRDTVCINTEEFFLKSLGHQDGGITKVERDQVIYTDDSGKPVLFAKGEGKVRSSISFTDIGIEGITFPAGTIFKVRKKLSFKHSVIKPGLLATDIDSITSLQPLRLSLFAIPHDERLEATLDKPMLKPAEDSRQAFVDSLPAISMLDAYLRTELGAP
jgi:hypothetical protein